MLAVGAIVIVLLAGGIFFVMKKDATPPPPPKKIGITEYILQMRPVVDGFIAGMEEQGYREGIDVVYVREPVAEGDVKKLTAINDTYIDQNVDLIFAVTSVSAKSALAETTAKERTDIPIVFSHANQVVEQKLVNSFKSSGNNMTGVAVNFAEVTERKLEFLKKINPDIKKIAVFDAAVTDPAGRAVMIEVEKAAPKFDLTVVKYPIKNDAGPASIEEAKATMSKMKSGDFDAYFHLPGNVVNQHEFILLGIDMTKRLKIPSVWHAESDVESGGLFSYGHDLTAMGKQTAVIISKVLKGTLPTDIPIEFPQKNSLTINKKVAQELGVTIPPQILSITDKVIE